MDALVRPLPTRKDSDEGVQVTFFNRLLRRAAEDNLPEVTRTLRSVRVTGSVAVGQFFLAARLKTGASTSVVFRSAKERPFAERKATIATVISTMTLNDFAKERHS